MSSHSPVFLPSSNDAGSSWCSAFLVALLSAAILAGCVPPDYTGRMAGPPVDERRQHALGVLHQAEVARGTADTAVQLDGTQQTLQVRQSAGTCMSNRTVCLNVMEAAKSTSQVGALAGIAYVLTQPLMREVWNRDHVRGWSPDYTTILRGE
jgi:hypothetical protein